MGECSRVSEGTSRTNGENLGRSIFRTNKDSRLFYGPGEPDHKTSEKPDRKQNPFGDESKVGCLSLAQLEFLAFTVVAVLLLVTYMVPELKKKDLLKMKDWKWEVCALIALSGRVIGVIVVRPLITLIEKKYFGSLSYLHYLYPLQTPFGYFISFLALLIVWLIEFTTASPPTELRKQANEYILKAIVSLLVASIYWLVQIYFTKWLEGSYFGEKFFPQIKNALFSQYMIETLLTKEPNLYQSHQTKMGGSGVIAKQEPKEGGRMLWSITFEEWCAMTPTNLNSWRVLNLVKILRDTRWEEIHNLGSDAQRPVNHLTQCEALGVTVGERIFSRVSTQGESFIREADLLEFMPPEIAKESMKFFADKATSGHVSLIELINWVVDTFKRRRELDLTLSDSRAALKLLGQRVKYLFFVIILVNWMLIFEGSATRSLFMFIISVLGLVGVVVVDPIKSCIQSVMFYFIYHPVDVGDICVVEQKQMTVEQSNLLSTVFTTSENDTVHYPNNVLFTQPILKKGPQDVVIDMAMIEAVTVGAKGKASEGIKMV